MSKNIHPTTSHPEDTTRSWRAPIAGLLAALLVATLVACGGGGGGSSAGVGTGGTGSFAVGTISGFGSVIVNGVRYDDSSASVVDDDGTTKSSSDLAIGQLVELRGSVNDDGLKGTASTIAYYSSLVGPVTSNTGGNIVVFGKTVNVTATTLFSGVADINGILVNDVIEVYGLPDATGVITATRIERKATPFTGDFRISGVVSSSVATSPGQRFTVGGTLLVQTDNATKIVNGPIVDGVFVRVRFGTTQAGDGSYLAKRVKVKKVGYEDGVNKAEVQGLISEFTSATAPFKVNGYAVQLGSSVTYKNGVVGDLVNDARIEAKGTVTSGVLVISKVEFDSENNDGGGDGSAAPYEFHGVVATCNPTPCASPSGEIVVHGARDVTVQYNSQTHIVGPLTAATLLNAKVEVKAIAQSGSGGTTLLATRIKTDN